MTHNTDTDTMILSVVLGEITEDQHARLSTRFHRFFENDRIEYPVSCESHAFDVFRDEFETEDGPPVDYAAIITLPYPVEQFTPFDEDEISGVLLFEASGEPGEWVAEPDIHA